jgi:hypothetical protein
MAPILGFHVDYLDGIRKETTLDLPLPLPLSWNDDCHENENDDNDVGVGVDGHARCSLHKTSFLLKRLQEKQMKKQQFSEKDSDARTLISIESLPPDVSATIYTHLTIPEIATVSEVSSALYVASRNPTLWRAKFVARWNYDDPMIFDWFLAYQHAYWNPQDLWITHWNCVNPSDGLGPGRCCIQDDDNNNSSNNSTIDSIANPTHLCPTCRYHPKMRPTSKKWMMKEGAEQEKAPTSCMSTMSIATVAQAIQAATNLRIKECSTSSSDDNDIPYHISTAPTPYSSRRANAAFAQSATFHRRLDTHQYRDRSLCFLQDLLFFQTHDVNDNDSEDDDDDDDEPVEMRDWKRHMKQSQAQAALFQNTHQESDGFEPALHSWHLAKLCNPDHHCPIVWRISIQRTDCFTVFPSEGLLQPGETKVVVFGVKPFGSMLAYATHQLNVHREGVDDVWAQLYTDEAHLPVAPFMIHYHYASVVPCRRADDVLSLPSFRQPSSNLPRHPNPHSIPNIGVGQGWQNQNSRGSHNWGPTGSPWEQTVQSKQPIRSFTLSSHVNGSFTLSEFRRRTLVPFSLPRHTLRQGQKFCKLFSPVIYCAPQLMEFYPKEWQRLQNLVLEEPHNSSSAARRYRTEEACQKCGLTWGPRMEELGQAYVLSKLESEHKWRYQRKRIDGLHRILQCLVQALRRQQAQQSDPKQQNDSAVFVIGHAHFDVVYLLHKRVMNVRATPWLSKRDSTALVQWEILLDTLARIYANNLIAPEIERPLRWRHAGVYRYALCTDSVFNQEKASLRQQEATTAFLNNIPFKDEQAYLEPFAHLAHSPGRFCLGLQEDPNHLHGPESLSKLQTKFFRRQLGCATDMFMDDPICGLQAAICVVSNPRSLLVHGIYDRIPYPGSICRRPKLPILPKLDSTRCHLYLRARYKLTLPSFIVSSSQLVTYELQNSLDMESLLLVNSLFEPLSHLHSVPYSISLRNFLRNIPPLGNGRFAVSIEQLGESTSQKFLPRLGRNQYWFLDTNISEIAEYTVTEASSEDSFNGIDAAAGSVDVTRNQPIAHPPNGGLHINMQQFGDLDNQIFLPRGPRIFSILLGLSEHLGWTVDDNQGAGSVHVDRRILIGAQWLSLSLMTAPLLWTLFARYAQWIPAAPVDYPLEALPFKVENKLRFLTEEECGYSAVLLLVLYLFLGRWVERYTNRDYFRAMLEHMPIENGHGRGLFDSLSLRIQRWCHRLWDATCPLFLQRLVFIPPWNRRSSRDLLKHIAFWRSQDFREHSSIFRAVSGRGRLFHEDRDRTLYAGDESIFLKVLIGTIVCLGSFSASTPHFFLNILTASSCSISLGLSMSLQSMETGRTGVVTTASTTGSMITTMSLVTVVILAFLVGQLVGSSGGVLFLAEFIVTTISLILGGVGAISASAMESWFTFFCFAFTAFIGYLLGRVAVMEGIRQKRSGFSSIMLCVTLVGILIFWTIASIGWKWETAIQLAIVRPHHWVKDDVHGVNSIHDSRHLP